MGKCHINLIKLCAVVLSLEGYSQKITTLAISECSQSFWKFTKCKKKRAQTFLRRAYSNFIK